MVHVGVDLHKRSSQLAVLTPEGEATQQRLENDPRQLEQFFTQLGGAPEVRGVGILVRSSRPGFGYDRPRALARRPSWETGATDTRSGSCLSARRSSGARARPSPSRDSAGPSPSSAPESTPSPRG